MYATNLVLASLVLALFAGCGTTDETDTDITDTGVADADTDTDADSDTDSDADADTDTAAEPTIMAVAEIPVMFTVDGQATGCGETTECVVPADEGDHVVSASKTGYLFAKPTQTVKVGESGQVIADFSGEGQIGLETVDGTYEGAGGEYDVRMDVVDGLVKIDLGIGIWATVTGDTFYGELENGSYLEGTIISATEIHYFNWSSFCPDDPDEDTITLT